MSRNIIIDTDPGVDDAMAIFFALRSPELNLIGLTTVFGNVHTDLATINALRLLEIAGRPDIPVAAGAANPIAGSYGGPVPFVHGDDGQGNVHLPPPRTKAVKETAAEFLIEKIMATPGQVTLIPLAPLTNLALALRLEPRIAQQVHEVILMGGNALEPGNATPSAEANIHNDPEAADIVFGAGWPITMVGLDVTHKVLMHPEQMAAYDKINNPMGQHIARILPFYRGFYLKATGVDAMAVHDSSAIAYAIDPTLFKTEQWPVRVEVAQGLSRGKTWPALRIPDFPGFDAWRNRPPVNVCVGVDSERLIALELKRISGT